MKISKKKKRPAAGTWWCWWTPRDATSRAERSASPEHGTRRTTRDRDGPRCGPAEGQETNRNRNDRSMKIDEDPLPFPRSVTSTTREIQASSDPPDRGGGGAQPSLHHARLSSREHEKISPQAGLTTDGASAPSAPRGGAQTRHVTGGHASSVHSKPHEPRATTRSLGVGTARRCGLHIRADSRRIDALASRPHTITRLRPMCALPLSLAPVHRVGQGHDCGMYMRPCRHFRGAPRVRLAT